MKPGPPEELRGADAIAQARAWDPSELLHISLVDIDDAALTS